MRPQAAAACCVPTLPLSAKQITICQSAAAASQAQSAGHEAHDVAALGGAKLQTLTRGLCPLVERQVGDRPR